MQAQRKRGRPAIADLMVPTQLHAFDRQKPPAELNDEETEVWAAVVSALEPDWFNPSNTPLLAQYCRHVIAAKRVAELIERHSGDLGAYLDLLQAQRAETSALKQIAASIRVSQQSTRTHRGNARTISQIRVPWQKADQG